MPGKLDQPTPTNNPAEQDGVQPAEIQFWERPDEDLPAEPRNRPDIKNSSRIKRVAFSNIGPTTMRKRKGPRKPLPPKRGFTKR